MPNAYICNSVDDKISVDLNSELVAPTLNPRSLNSNTGTNNLPVRACPIVEKADKGKLGRQSDNTLVIRFDTLRDDPKTYEIEVDEGVEQDDLYFYVFDNTLVGHDKNGRSKGISIRAHEAVKKVIQDGIQVQGINILDILKPA